MRMPARRLSRAFDFQNFSEASQRENFECRKVRLSVVASCRCAALKILAKRPQRENFECEQCGKTRAAPYFSVI